MCLSCRPRDYQLYIHGEDVTLTLTVVAGGSADVTVDYEPLLVPVVIRAGLSELTVSIRTIDDDVSEETRHLSWCCQY